ncbi:sensor histidine kinase [Paenibacillus sp. 1P07SE]|uniref:sensor histidine kinase n=1 Tax=Paenibacillus sp. 1P07SE TaxID=3132209 RepID=UPI0039A469FB
MVWKRMVQFLLDRSFFTKIFLTVALVSVIGIVSIVFLYQRYFQSVLLDMEVERTRTTVEQTNRNIDSYMRQIVSDMFHFVAYSKNGAFLMQADIHPLQLTEDYKQAADLMSAFRYRYPVDVESAFFFREGAFFTDYNLKRLEGVDYTTQQWYTYYEQQSREMWLAPSEEVLFDKDTPERTISLAMGMYDMFERNGIFVVRLNPQLFREAYRHLASEDLTIELFDREGRLVYTSRQPTSPDAQGEWLTIEDTLSDTGFRTSVRLNKTAVYNKVSQVKSLNIYVIMAVLLVSWVLAIVLSLTLVRPVRRLHGLMKRVEIGDLEVHYPVRYRDEIGKLGTGFNKMISSLSSLIHEVYDIRLEKMRSELKQKEATIMAMQSQINPHFLYNTLEAINCHAIVHDVPSISKMSKALADFFRYSIEKQQVIVPLFKEVKHVETYLDIQYQRRPDIEVIIRIPEQLQPCPIIKLTLQPLIENAFIHGFKGEKDYWLSVWAEESPEQHCLIHVEDNGVGMDPEAIAEMNARFEELALAHSEGPAVTGGIGLPNVHQRLSMQFGPRYGLTLQPSAAGGLQVTVRLPWKQDRENSAKEGEDESLNRG